MTGFPINPPHAPLVERDGRTITTEWYKFFRDIQSLLGGASSPFDNAELLSGHTTAAAAPTETLALSGPPAAPVERHDGGVLHPPAQPAAERDDLTPPHYCEPHEDLMYPPTRA